MAAIQVDVAAAPAEQVQETVERAFETGSEFDLNESDTRKIIDAQLREAGWTVDTQTLTYGKGTRPIKGQALAIAEWPTANGPADYMLFSGLTPIAVVEAKRKSVDVRGSIEQAKRYSRGYTVKGDEKEPGGPWGDYKIPFMFATTDGRT